MPAQHAKLSPSSSARWLQCPGSVKASLALEKDDEGSVYAGEGTLAHALAEITANREHGRLTDKGFLAARRAWEKEAKAFGTTTEQREDMERHVQEYLVLVAERLARHPASQVFFEQRLDTGIPTCWGTSDTVIVSPVHVEIIDFKYGAGVQVDAPGNTQLRLYALGALEAFDGVLGDVETVYATIHQPRMSHVSTEALTAEELRTWRDDVALPGAELALSDDAPFNPSEKACRWCPLAGQCRPQLEWATQRDFGEDPVLLTPEDLAEALGDVPRIRQWLDALEKAALTKAYDEQVPLPGYKVVMSGGKRFVKDQAGAIAALRKKGFKVAELTTTSIKGLGDLERLLKRLPKVQPNGAARERYQRLEDVLPPDTLGQTEGKASLVPDTDNRPDINPTSEAQREFADE